MSKPADAQTSDDSIYADEGFVSNAWADPARCNLGNARRMSLADALKRIDSDYGNCVAIPAYVDDHALYATRRERALTSSPALNTLDRRIGFYAKDSVTKYARRHPRTRYWAVGRLSECRRAWPEAMVMGYCHYNKPPAVILIVAEIRAIR